MMGDKWILLEGKSYQVHYLGMQSEGSILLNYTYMFNLTNNLDPILSCFFLGSRPWSLPYLSVNFVLFMFVNELPLCPRFVYIIEWTD